MLKDPLTASDEFMIMNGDLSVKFQLLSYLAL